MKKIRSYYISQGKTPEDHLHHIKKMVDAKVDAVQLRIKNLNENQWINIAFEAQKYCKKNNCIFIVNDSVSVALKVDADGVHLGKEDTPIDKARMILGNSKIIGATANTIADCINLTQKNVDYIGLGPFRFTFTKKNLSPILGEIGYKNIINQLKLLPNTPPPIIAIGGIEQSDFISLKNIGVQGIALSGLLHKSEDPKTIIHNIQYLFL